jgi:hypothetical protein
VHFFIISPLSFRAKNNLDHIDNRNRDIPIRDFPTGLRAIVEDRCWKVNPSLESARGGIRDQRIGGPKGVSFTHSHFTILNFR